MKTFRDWLVVREASAFTRTRGNAALNLGPSIPDASINSRSTALPSVCRAIKARNRGRLVSPSIDGDEG